MSSWFMISSKVYKPESKKVKKKRKLSHKYHKDIENRLKLNKYNIIKIKSI